MRVPYSWLQAFFPDVVLPKSRELAEKLTMAGLEVEGIENVGFEAPGVLIAAIEAIEPLEEHLSRVKIRCGITEAVVICAAENLQVGAKVLYASAGAKINDQIMTETLIHGFTSQGMLCSRADLGLEGRSSGVWLLPDHAPVGQHLSQWWGKEEVLVLKLTPNRGDCLSIAGVAREVAALYGLTTAFPHGDVIAHEITDTCSVSIEEPNWCASYMGAVAIAGNGQTPIWMLQKLLAAGVRPINLWVDITNYIMLELGQPLHAFDADTIQGGIHVRRAKAGESLLLLNGTKVDCALDILVIADEGKPLAMAGIMGGKESGVSDKTRRVFFESAHFCPEAVRGKARRFKLTSEAAHRFERGVDPNLPEMALRRALFLAQTIGQAKVGPLTKAWGTQPITPDIAWNPERINQLLGTSWPAAFMAEILQRLAISVKEGIDSWRACPPSCRFDLRLEEDLAEEIGRVAGYENIEPSLPAAPCTFFERQDNRQRIRHMLCARDYIEVITYTFSEPQLEMLLGAQSCIELLNPIIQTMPILRAGLWGKLLETVKTNQSRKIERLRLFEIGRVFEKIDGQIDEREQLAGVVTGPFFDHAWKDQRKAGFFEVKKDLEALFPFLQFQKSVHPGLHPGQSARLLREGHAIGWLGVLHPKIAEQLEIGEAILFNVELHPSLFPSTIQLKENSVFPEIRRDLSLLVPFSLEWQQIKQYIEEAGVPLLQKVEVFDLYEGKGVPAGEKSLGVRLFFQAYDRTLTDEEIDGKIKTILQGILPLGAHLREGVLR
jgi:phenylalanyl-tRNA synthetase beta chain